MFLQHIGLIFILYYNIIFILINRQGSSKIVEWIFKYPYMLSDYIVLSRFAIIVLGIFKFSCKNNVSNFLNNVLSVVIDE